MNRKRLAGDADRLDIWAASEGGGEITRSEAPEGGYSTVGDEGAVQESRTFPHVEVRIEIEAQDSQDLGSRGVEEGPTG